MEKIVHVSDAMIATEEDMNRLGTFARESLDHVVGDAVGAPYAFSGFAVAAANQQTLTAAPGRFYAGDKVFVSGDVQTIDVAAHLPAQSNIFKWIALVLRGQSATLTESRQVEVDADTEELISENLVVADLRVADLLIQQGLEAPTPIKPTIAVDQAAVAYIKLGSTGVIEIERAEEYRLKSLTEVEHRVTAGEKLDATQGVRIGSIETDLANVAGAVKATPRPEVWRQMRKDLAKLRRQAAFPDEARATFFDYGLVKDQWDTGHASWYARVREGIRFFDASIKQVDMELLDPGDPGLRLSSDMLLPTYTEVPRIVVEGNDGEVSISNITHTVTTAIRREISRSSVSYGPTFNVCENRAEWSNLADRRPGETFSQSGETFNVVALTDHVNNSDPELSQDHKEYAVRSVTYDSWTEVYWDYVTEQVGLSGSIYAQTFLNSQPGWMTSIDLNFSRIGEAEDVTVLVTELDLSGQPDLDRVIGSTTIPHGSLSTGWNKATFKPTFLSLGRRYAWVVITTGNHWLAKVSNNKFAQGSMFHTTDGVWFQGSITEDFPCRVNFAHFETARLVVPFNPMTLENGIGSFRLLFGGWVPSGTALQFEIKPEGSDAWYPIANYDQNLLAGLPPLIQYRVVFVGTTDLMPGIDLNQAKVETVRPANNFTAVSEEWVFGITSDEIVVEAVIDTWDDILHAYTPKLIAGGVVEDADTVTVEVDPDNAEKRLVRATFNLPAPVADCRLQLEGTTTSVVQPYFLQDIFAYAL